MRAVLTACDTPGRRRHGRGGSLLRQLVKTAAVVVAATWAAGASAQVFAPAPMEEPPATAYWSASVGYGARAHFNNRASGTLSDLVTLGHTYGPTWRVSAAYHTAGGWVYAAALDDGRSHRSSDEVTDLFEDALAAYPGDFFPDYGSSAYAFQPDIANRYTLGLGRDLRVGTWTLTPHVTAGLLDVRLAGVGRTYKQRDANARYDLRLRPSVTRLAAPVFGTGAELGGRLYRGLGIRLSAQAYYARPRYRYALVARELLSGREDVTTSPPAGAWLVGQLTAGLSYRLPY